MFRSYETRRDYFNNRRQKYMNFIREYKSDKCCFACGWKLHPDILQFHHRNPKEKENKLSKGSMGNMSQEKIDKEIAKCDLLCPNCHFWLHYQESAKLE